MKEGCYFAEKKHGSPNFEIVKHDRIDTTSNTEGLSTVEISTVLLDQNNNNLNINNLKLDIVNLDSSNINESFIGINSINVTNPSLIISNFGIWHWDWGTLGNKLSKKYLP